MRRLSIVRNVSLLLCSASIPVLAAQPVPPPKPAPSEAKPAEPNPQENTEPADGTGPRESAKPGPVARPKRTSAEKPATAVPAATDSRLPQAIGPIELRETKDPASGKAVLVITNDDLSRIYGRSTVTPTTAASDPMSGERAGVPAGAQPATPAAASDPAARVAQAEQELQRLRSNAMKLRNPLLGAPVQSAEEKEKMQGEDNAQRLAQTESQISQLEAELASLRGAGSNSQEPKR